MSRAPACLPCALLLLLPGAARGAAPVRDELDPASYELNYRVPGMDKVQVRADLPYRTAAGTTRRLDLYRPPNAPGGSSVVVFVNGVGLPALKGWGQYRSWGRLIAASGMAAVTFESVAPDADADLAALIAFLREHAKDLGIDPDRIALWACSANTPVALRYATSAAGAPLKAAVLYYGLVPNPDQQRIRPDLPVMLVRAGRDGKELAADLTTLSRRALAENAPWTIVNALARPHALEIIDPSSESGWIVATTVAFLSERLRPAASAAPLSLAHQALLHTFAAEPEEALAVYRRMLAEQPDDARLAGRVAFLNLQQGHLEEAAAGYRRAIALGDRSRTSWYNLACASARAGKAAEAFEALEEALAAGFADRAQIASDTDLESLRADPRFSRILDRLK